MERQIFVTELKVRKYFLHKMFKSKPACFLRKQPVYKLKLKYVSCFLISQLMAKNSELGTFGIF